MRRARRKRSFVKNLCISRRKRRAHPLLSPLHNVEELEAMLCYVTILSLLSKTCTQYGETVNPKHQHVDERLVYCLIS